MIEFDISDDIAWVTLSRPEKLNAMSREFWPQLRSAIGQINNSPKVRVAVFSGAGRCFSVGGDIESFSSLPDAAARRAFSEECLNTLRMVEDTAVPTIAAVHGFALGGGCELTMVCDIVIADATAEFGMPEASIGLMPGLGVVRGRAHVNLHAMKYLVLTGRRLSADEARQTGLVNLVVPAGGHVEEARKIAGEIARKAPLALKSAKRILNRGSEEGYSYSVEAVAMLHGTSDQAEGIRSFTEHREPEFTGA